MNTSWLETNLHAQSAELFDVFCVSQEHRPWSKSHFDKLENGSTIKKAKTLCSDHGKNCIIDNKIAIHNVVLVYIWNAPESNNSYVRTTTKSAEDITSIDIIWFQ